MFNYIKSYFWTPPSSPNLNARNTEGRTALFRAVDSSDYTEVERLIAAGANINLQDKWGSSPLMRSISRQHPGIIRLLIEAGADLNSQHSNGNTAIHMAVSLGYKSIVRTLIDVGADVNIANNLGNTPLYTAINKPFPDKALVQMLLDAGANKRNILRHAAEKQQAANRLALANTYKEMREPVGNVLEIGAVSELPTRIDATVDSLIISPIGMRDLPELPDTLKYLAISGNPITGLPTSLPSHLRVLICADCGLRDLPDLPESLEFLDVRNNFLHDIRRLPSGLFIMPISKQNTAELTAATSNILLGGNPLPTGLLNGIGSVTQYSSKHIHKCIDFGTDGKVCTMIIPRGTLLFRDSRHPYREEEVRGIYDEKTGEYYIYPEFNVFFYMYPFVGEMIIETNYVHIFELTRDVEVVMGVAPSMNKRSDRHTSGYLVNCSKIDTGKEGLKGLNYDPCFTRAFSETHKEVNGFLGLAGIDTTAHLENKPYERFWSKYRTLHADAKNNVGVAELILHPCKDRFDPASEHNFRHVASVPHIKGKYDALWEMVESRLREGEWTVDLFTKMWVRWDGAADEVKARCVPPEDPYKLWHMNTSYWSVGGRRRGGQKTRRRRGYGRRGHGRPSRTYARRRS